MKRAPGYNRNLTISDRAKYNKYVYEKDSIVVFLYGVADLLHRTVGQIQETEK
jgi:hypothetical protein